mgnify:CR=1 FL=1
MRFTRRLLDRPALSVLLPVHALAMSMLVAGCSESAHPSREVSDAGDGDRAVTPPPEDGGAPEVDASQQQPLGPPPKPLEVKCEKEPCALRLTTTLAGLNGERDEGYCVLLSDKTVACWGANNGGQLATGPDDREDRTVPVRIAGLSDVTHLHHTCAVDAAGTIRCWGTGAFAQSPTSAWSVETTPVAIPLDAPAEKVALSPATLACALLRSGEVYCWGANNYGVLGSDAPHIAPPTKIQGLPSGIRDIELGTAAFALLDDGRLVSWGSAPGIGRPTSFGSDPTPGPVALEGVSAIDVAHVETCVVAEGTGWCWGAAIPQGSALGAEFIADANARALPLAVDTPTRIARIATTRTHSRRQGSAIIVEQRRFCATDGEGDVYCWGLNNVGQAGTGDREYVTETARVQGLAGPAADVKVLPYSTCALLTNGKVQCWGSNLEGQLGAGLPRGLSVVPVEVKLP